MLGVSERSYQKIRTRLEQPRQREREKARKEYMALMEYFISKNGGRIGGDRLYYLCKRFLQERYKNVPDYLELVTYSLRQTYRHQFEMRHNKYVEPPRRRYVHTKGSVEVEIMHDGGFNIFAPNTRWSSDFTEIQYVNSQGIVEKCYACFVMDCCDNSLQGFAVGEKQTTELAIMALSMALILNVGARPILHTDRGTQFTSDLFKKFLRDHHIAHSFSRVKKCTDNALSEQLFAKLKNFFYNRKRKPQNIEQLQAKTGIDCKFMTEVTISSLADVLYVIQNYVWQYNTALDQSTLGGYTPLERRAHYFQRDPQATTASVLTMSKDGVNPCLVTYNVKPDLAIDPQDLETQDPYNHQQLHSLVEMMMGYSISEVAQEEITDIGIANEETRKHKIDNLLGFDESKKHYPKKMFQKLCVESGRDLESIYEVLQFLPYGVKAEIVFSEEHNKSLDYLVERTANSEDSVLPESGPVSHEQVMERLQHLDEPLFHKLFTEYDTRLFITEDGPIVESAPKEYLPISA